MAECNLFPLTLVVLCTDTAYSLGALAAFLATIDGRTDDVYDFENALTALR